MVEISLYFIVQNEQATNSYDKQKYIQHCRNQQHILDKHKSNGTSGDVKVTKQTKNDVVDNGDDERRRDTDPKNIQMEQVEREREKKKPADNEK